MGNSTQQTWPLPITKSLSLSLLSSPCRFTRTDETPTARSPFDQNLRLWYAAPRPFGAQVKELFQLVGWT